MQNRNILSVEDRLNSVSYEEDPNYVPSVFALEFVNFIKLVNGAEGEENKTPVLHLRMLDKLASGGSHILNMLYRGSAKTTLFGEYLFLYLAVYGELPGFGEVTLAIYVSDSIENGVKNMRRNLEYRRENSEFLMKMIPEVRFTDIRWEFTNLDGKKLIVKAYGAQTGVRGAKEAGRRVDLAVLDDLLDDSDAKSPTVIASIEDTVGKKIEYALHPSKSKVIWNGTPFNQRDPLYKAAESGTWEVNVFPICEEFNDSTTKEEFKGAWEDRHNYEYVKEKYDRAKQSGRIQDFLQELMLRISSDEDRLIDNEDICWYNSELIDGNLEAYNWYITTDLATSEKTSSDYRVVSVWAYNSNGDWMLHDGFISRELLDVCIDRTLDLVVKYGVLKIGIETSGQQGGFVTWIRKEVMTRSVNVTVEPVRPERDKVSRFHVMVPMFKRKKMFFNKDMVGSKFMTEMTEELRLASVSGFKSKHDDAIDTVSMLQFMKPWKPASYDRNQSNSGPYELIKEPTPRSGLDSYIV